MRRRGFTLMELLIVMMIIAILAAMALSALSGAVETAREQRTRSIIAKVDQLVMDKWESYRTRPVPMRVPHDLVPNMDPSQPPVSVPVPPRLVALMRLHAIRDLARMEVPDRKSDVIDGPADLDPRNADALNTHEYRMKSPALRNSYIRKAMRATGSANLAQLDQNWTATSQGAECLYLIISNMRDGDKNAVDFFSASEIGDYDEDGMLEILDAWGRPIEFLRWAPGYTIEAGAMTLQTNALDSVTGQPTSPDQLDPLRVDARWGSTGTKPYYLYPLIYSGGSDGVLDVFTDNTSPTPLHRYCPGSLNNSPDPYAAFADGPLAGTPMDRDSSGSLDIGDNITSHYLEY